MCVSDMRCYFTEVGEDAKLERADLFFSGPQRLHIIVGGSAAWCHALAAPWREPGFLCADVLYQRFEGGIAEAGIGRGGHQSFRHDRPCFSGSDRRIIDGSRETDQCAGQFVL